MVDTSPRKVGNILTVDDLLGVQAVSDAQIHPDGNVIAYVIASNVCEPRQSQAASRIWLTDDKLGPRPATAEGTRASKPRWSSDGRKLAFLGAREIEDKDQLFLLDAGWSEARQATSCPGGATALAWIADGSIALLITDPPPDDEDTRKESGRDEIVYEQHHRFSRLWRYDPTTDELTQLVHDDVHIWECEPSPDGRSFVALVSDEPYNWSWYGARLVRIDLPDGTLTTIREPRKQVTHPTWSPDGQQIAIISCTWSDHGMSGGDVILLNRDGSGERTITGNHPRSYLDVSWEQSKERLFCTAIEDGESVIGYLGLDGAFESLSRTKTSLLRWAGRTFTQTRDGDRIAMVRGATDDPADVWTLELEGQQQRWTRQSDTNSAIRDHLIAPTETLHWTARDGTRLQGLLVRPPDHDSAALPMITLIHGGPTSLWTYDFPAARSMAWVQLLASEGYAVLLPNPRGSMGWGTAFAEANIGDMGGGDLQDVLAGVDYCIEQGIADPERLGVAGWSYGGYLTPLAITQTQRFKAAVSGASITNWISFHGVSTIPGFDSTFYQVDPFNWDGHYGQFSPVAHVRRVRTPTLWLHGERDPICPVGQAYEMWRAMKELGIETELVVYPREGHGIREREHARDVLERTVNWIKRYV